MVKSNARLKDLLEQNRAIHKEYNEAFLRLDALWKKGVHYVQEERTDEKVCFLPIPPATKEYTNCLGVLNNIEKRSMLLQRKINACLGYTVKEEDRWNEMCRRDDLRLALKREEEKRLKSELFALDQVEEEVYNNGEITWGEIYDTK